MSQRVKQEVFSTQVLQILDACLIWCAFLVANWLRDPIRVLLNFQETGEVGINEMIWVVYIMVPLTPFILGHIGFYKQLRRRSLADSCHKLIRGIFIAGVVIGIVAVFAKVGEPRRLILGTGFLTSFLLLLIRDQMMIRVLQIRANGDRFAEHVIISGQEDEIKSFLVKMSSEESERIKIVGRFNPEKQAIEQLCKMIERTSTQRVILLTDHVDFARIAEAVEACEIQGVEAWVGAALLPTQIAQLSFDAVAEQPMLVFRSTPEFSWQLVAKQFIDCAGSLAILILSSPLWLIAWIGIKITSSGASAIFKQERSGLYGRKFWIYKFRTMVPDAETLLAEVKNDLGNEVDGPAFKLNGDPRIFPFGAFLRKFSIDELPQLLNVLKGEMSLVGPRPLPVHETEAMSDSAHRRRLSMKPGLTCLWQVSGRSSITDFRQWVDLDTKYIDNWCIWLDFKILLMTIPAVFWGRGAK